MTANRISREPLPSEAGEFAPEPRRVVTRQPVDRRVMVPAGAGPPEDGATWADITTMDDAADGREVYLEIRPKPPANGTGSRGLS